MSAAAVLDRPAVVQVTSSLVPLRPYQRAGLDAVHAARARGVTRQLLSMATGSGKTVLAAHLIAEIGQRTVFLVHRDELVRQALTTLRRVNPNLRLGVCKADLDDLGADVIIASAQTLAQARRLERLRVALAGAPLLFVADECFPAGTLIDGRPIETIRVGDTVTAFDENSGTFTKGRVMRTFARVPSAICSIMVGSKVVTCTPNHPFWTRGGWCPAEQLQGREVLLHEGLHADLYALRGSVSGRQEQSQPVSQNGRHPMLAGVHRGSQLGHVQPHQSGARSRTDEDQQPDAPRRQLRANEDHAQSYGASPAAARRQWTRPDRPAADDGGRAWGRLDCGVSDTDVRRKEFGQRTAACIQTGHRAPRLDGSDRSRWLLAQPLADEGGGRPQGRVARWARVDRVEVQERGGDGRFGGLCPDGRVYNFEVEGLHTYVANGFVVHNCHHDLAPSRYRAITTLNPDLLVGLTATPNRADKAGLDALYQEVVFHLPMLELIAMGKLSPLKGLRIDTETDIDAVRTQHGEFAEGELADTVNTPGRNRLIVESYHKHCADRKRTVAFCVNVAHAEALAAAFRDAGIRAECVFGHTPTDERQATLEAFHMGQIPVLVNVMVLSEGYDEPGIDCVLWARPTKSQSLYIQCIGRAARLSEDTGKTNAIIVDFVDSSSKHRLITLPVLAGKEPQPASAGGGYARAGEQMDLLDVSETETRVRERAAVAVNLFGGSPFVWRTVGGVHMANARMSAWVALVPEGGGFVPYEVFSGERGSEVSPLFDRPLDLETAFGVAESKVELTPLSDSSARWRLKPPAEKQVEFARKLGIEVGPEMRRGELSALIDDKLFSRAMRQFFATRREIA